MKATFRPAAVEWAFCSSMMPAAIKHVASLLLLGLVSLTAHAADVVYIDRVDALNYNRQQVETAAAFWGLHTIILPANRRHPAEALRSKTVVAVIIAADALESLSQDTILPALRRNGARPVPLLIAGLTDRIRPEIVRRWSDASIEACSTRTLRLNIATYRVASAPAVTRQLGGSTLPLRNAEVAFLSLSAQHGAQPLISAVSGEMVLPVFARTLVRHQELFFATANPEPALPITPDPYREPAVFAALAPQLIFLRYAAAERAWHAPGHYANLTIDDPWLREPYGHLNYHQLLLEMRQHNFHTTIAFIPWNFDRSDPQLVSLIRTNTDRFSISVHGNNHDHQEFGAYSSRPLSQQAFNIDQAVARMARFTSLTGLPYDRVMVFPHSIAPEETLGLLKRANYVATVNFLNVPLDAKPPSDPEFSLRPVILSFSDFPSFRRYSEEAPRPESQLAIDAFLDNPMLFFAHHDFFASGMGAFNRTASVVNQLQPDTQWSSLGFIAQHFYLEKLRDDGNYDIRAFTSRLRLRNSHDRASVFFVRKDEDFSLPFIVAVNGQPFPYERSGRQLLLTIPLQPGEACDIAVEFKTPSAPAAVDVARRSLRISTIRLLSDFRDNVVSQSRTGRLFVRAYARNRTLGNASLMLLSLSVVVTTAFVVRRRGKRPMP